MRLADAQRLLTLPEINLAVFAFLLHFAWEMIQLPLYNGVEDARYVDILTGCLLATLGDVVIVLVAFWTVALADRSRRTWLVSPTFSHVVRFTALGVLITISLELLATRAWDRWSYGELMPVFPLLGVGLSPLIQWLILPPLIVWFVRRQLT